MKFKSDIEVQAGLKDSSGTAGTSGQVLSSNGTTVSWVNAGSSVASDVQNQVKAGVAINKGQAVYVTGADGTNIIVGLASNTSEATSSKTLGLLNATVSTNGFADVVQIGKLSGLNTSTATIGDPVWLGTGGNLIYGLTNKPYAPAHLVYIGVVTRVNANNGEIFINVQNGFELKELHDVSAQTPANNNGIFYNTTSGLWEAKAISAAGGVEGTGTSGQVAFWNGTSSITGESALFWDSTNDRLGIGTTSPLTKLHIEGDNSSTTDETLLTLRGRGENGKRIDFRNEFGSLARITGTKLAGGASANEGILTFETATDSVLSEKMRITSSGNVGIGNTIPLAKMTVRGGNLGNSVSMASTIFSSQANDQGIFMGSFNGTPSYGSWIQVGREAFDLQFDLSLQPQGGNVGIGTTIPLTRFSVVQNVDVSSITSGSMTAGISLLATSGIYGLNIATSNSTGTTFIQNHRNDGNTTVYPISINPNGGNVGIGTTSPYLSKLHILRSESGSNPTPVLRIGNQGAGYTSRIVLTDETTNDANISYIGSTQYLGFGLGASLNQMVLTSGGNLLINTTTDAGYKLDVNGNARVQTAIGVNAAPNTVYPVTIGCTSGANGLKIIGRSDNLGYIEFVNNNGTTVNSSLNGSTGGLQVTGATTFSSTVTATGFFNSSDIRLKEIVSQDGDIIEFTWKDGRDNKKHIGVIAQEVQKLYPDMVQEGTDEEKTLSVNYIELLVLKNRQLEKRIESLEKLILNSK